MAYGIFRKVTTLEFFQHHFAKSGHGDGLLMTRQLISTFRQPPLHYLTRSVRRTSGFVLADHPGAVSYRRVPPCMLHLSTSDGRKQNLHWYTPGNKPEGGVQKTPGQ